MYNSSTVCMYYVRTTLHLAICITTDYMYDMYILYVTMYTVCTQYSPITITITKLITNVHVTQVLCMHVMYNYKYFTITMPWQANTISKLELYTYHLTFPNCCALLLNSNLNDQTRLAIHILLYIIHIHVCMYTCTLLNY